jgi:hypothetical protein
MKNLFKVLGIAVIIAAIGFSMATCADDSGGGGGGGGSGLTITGMPSQANGMYIAATGFDDEYNTFYLCSSININGGYMTAAKISGGSAKLNVWMIDDDYKTSAYTGSDTLELHVNIYQNAKVDNDAYPLLSYGGYVKFTNGTATIDAGDFMD